MPGRQTAIACTLMRGGTSKGPFFLASDLPAQAAARDRVLLAVMGSPDLRQIDGLGGAHPLTSKVALIGPPTRPDADVDYLFLQVGVDRGGAGELRIQYASLEQLDDLCRRLTRST